MNGLSITVELKAEDDYKAIKAALTRVNVLPLDARWVGSHAFGDSRQQITVIFLTPEDAERATVALVPFIPER